MKIFSFLLLFCISLFSKDILFTKDETKYLKQKPTINLCIDPNWLPFEAIVDGKHTGISSDYFKLFQKNIPIPIKLIETTSWNETLNYAKSRRCDIVSILNKTPKRSKYMNFTTPYIKTPFVVVTNVLSEDIKDVDKLRGKKIGVVQNSSLVEKLSKEYPFLDIVIVKNTDDGLIKLKNNDIFGMVGNMIKMGYNIQNNYMGKLKINYIFSNQYSNLSIGVRNDDKILLSILQKSIDNISQQEHTNIINKWIAIQYKDVKNYDTIFEILFVATIVIILILYRQNRLYKTNEKLYLSQLKLNQSLNEFQSIINAIIDAIIIVKNDIISDVNDIALDMFDCGDKSEILNISPLKLVSDESYNIVKEHMQTGDDKPYNINAKKLNGEIFPVIVRGKTIKLKSQDVRVITVVDITELREKDNLLIQKEKLASLGEMIGNIAHQWRQPLNVISTSISSMKLKYMFGETINEKDMEEYSKTILDSCFYLSDTIDTFRDFIKDDKEKKMARIDKVFDDTISIVDATLHHHGISISKNIQDNIELYFYVGEFEQVIINILNNAKDILIQNNIEEPQIYIDVKKSKNKLIVTIEDNGGGVPKDIISHIFEPYFTTKHKSKGTGLGLHMSYRIVTQSLNGNIYVKNTDQGAKFFIEIPI
jgi:two-component system sensor histidine kinase EvgS